MPVAAPAPAAHAPTGLGVTDTPLGSGGPGHRLARRCLMPPFRLASLLFAGALGLAACGGGESPPAGTPLLGSTATATPVAGAGPVATSPQATASGLTVAGVLDDRAGPHDAIVAGVSPDWSWGSAADPGWGLHGQPAGWTAPAYTMWGIVAAAAAGSPATNVRVQIRDLRTDFRRAGAWTRVQSEREGIIGEVYTDFSTNTAVPADMVRLGSEGVAVRLPAGTGNFHFYPSGRVAFPPDLQALVVSMDVRLIPADPAGIDDLDSARLYAVAAGDVWRSTDAQWSGSGVANGHAPIGRFRLITREWRTITASLGLADAAAAADYVAWAATQQ